MVDRYMVARYVQLKVCEKIKELIHGSSILLNDYLIFRQNTEQLEKSESIKREAFQRFFLQISYCKSSVRFGFGSAELYFLVTKFGSVHH